MTSPKTITGTLHAYVSDFVMEHCINPEMIVNGDPDVLQYATFRAEAKDRAEHTLIGTAVITMTLLPLDAVVTNQVASLRQQIKNVRAEAENKATQLERQVQQLLAITMDAGATS